MINLICVGLGAGIGAYLRYLTSKYITSQYYLGTLLVNLIGSFCLGYFATLNLQTNLYALLGIGFCGGLTTFSTYNNELFQLFNHKRYRYFVTYFIGTYGLSFTALCLGLFI